MKQTDFNKIMIGRFYLQDLIKKEDLKKLKDRGEKDEKSVRRQV